MNQSIRGMGKRILEAHTYDTILLLGEITILNEAIINDIKLTGDITAADNVEIRNLKLLGEMKCDKNVRITQASIIGKVQIAEDLDFTDFKVKGEVNVSGRLRGDNIDIIGMLQSTRDCEVDNFNVNGKAQIEGMLNADSIEFKVQEDSYIREIGGDQIKILEQNKENSKKSFITVVSNQKTPAYLTAEIIEGDTIEVNAVKAKMIRGDHVVIGDNVEVDKVEYTNSLECAPHAQVKEVVKL
ncbi:hypothetical protein MUA90_00870 [Staphylococcus sp. IVB6181]|uniref:hypothetical protein n=1 Tax=Staphylococcus sp. IVB6181 TaxID=2929481 RepID=UPI0021CE93F1|nr:hypothetical protein [Staphylococcus sp. IVB6181]UXV35132.1 hypothetical protein MUA90_00870 [Staphylococcus sp. IVB6181]